MRSAQTFTVHDPRFSTSQVIGPSMLAPTGRSTGGTGNPFGDPFRGERVRGSLSGWVRQRAGELVDARRPSGAGDLQAAVAVPPAVETMSRVLDLSGVEAADVRGWYEAIAAAVHTVTEGHPVPDEGKQAFAAMREAVSRRLAGSALLSRIHTGGDLSLDEIVSNVAVLLFGGIVTSEGSTALALQYLLAEPGALAELNADRWLIAGVVEEAFRLEPSASVVDRYATREVELDSATIRQGDLVRASLAGANRDPTVFPDPDRFDIHRPRVGTEAEPPPGRHQSDDDAMRGRGERTPAILDG